MSAGVGLRGDVVSDGYPARKVSLFRRDQTGLDQPADHRLRRRTQEALGHLGPGDLGDQPVADLDPPGPVPGQPGQPIAHHLWGEVEEGRRLNAAHLVAQAQVDHVPLHGQLVRAVDEVAREGQPGRVTPDRRQRLVHPGVGHPGRAEGREKPVPGQRGDHRRRGDPVRHRTGHVRMAHTVVAREIRRPQPVGRQRRDRRQHLRTGADQPLVVDRGDSAGIPDDETRPFEGGQHLVDVGRGAGRTRGRTAARRTGARRADTGKGRQTGRRGHHGSAPSSRSSTAISVSS